ncbi:MAG: non-canonical purine NTP pyrophosphatase [Bdellovibrionales bacterium]|nr:non-canonical purine NTP pyrophosphatase [Bdellovibrionales bacterium]
MRLANKIILASLNNDKLFEFRDLLKAHAAAVGDIDLVSAEAVLRNPEKLGMVENHNTYLENATAKARLCNHGSHYPSLSDDSGLEVAALQGKPGVRSHRYAKIPAGQISSRMNQDKANIDQLLTEMKGKSDRSAKFVCALSLVIEGILVHATGTLEGTIAESPKGENGFGYDSVFVPSGSSKTLAEMTMSEKNGISHRKLALDRLILEIRARGIVFAKP